MSARDQTPGGGWRFPGRREGTEREMPLDQPGTRSREGLASMEGSAFFTEQDIKDLAGQLAVSLFGDGSIFGDVGLRTATNKRKSDHFEPHAVTILDQAQPTKIVERQKGRIELVLQASKLNTQTVYVGGGTVKSSGADQGLELVPGAELTIDTTIDDVWGIPAAGGGNQVVAYFESVDYAV